MRINRVLLAAFVVALATCMTGCSAMARWQFVVAQRLEQSGRFRNAASFYKRSLHRIPAGDARWRSETLYRLGECYWSLNQPVEAFVNFQSAAEADTSNSLARLRLGEILLAGGAVDRATEQAAAVLQSASGNTEALALLGAASSASGQNVLAEAAFRKVLEREPGRVNIAVALADILNSEDREADARQVLHRAASSQPGSSLALLALGRLEEQEGNAAAAEAAYRQAVEREDTPDSNLRLAQFLERSSRVDEAEKVLERVDRMRPAQPTALPDFQLLSGRAVSALDQYLGAIRSPALSAQAATGNAFSGAGRVALAARIVEADLQNAAGGGNPAATAAARAHLEEYRNEFDSATLEVLRAEVALAEGDISVAEQRAASAVALAPNSAAAQYVLGIAKRRAGDSVGARAAWLEAAQQDSTFVPARLALTQEALRAGDVTGAEQYVLPTVRSEPGNVRALVLYARVLLALRRPASAGVIARRALAIQPQAAEPHVVLGESAVQAGRYADALIHFERALVSEPRSVDALNGLVRLYHRGVITRPMLRRMEVVAATPPASATLMEIAGRLYAERGWYTDAERCLRQSASIDPQRSSALLALAQTFSASGNTMAAAESAARMGGGTAAIVTAFAAQEKRDLPTAIERYEAAMRAGEHSGIAANNLAWLYAQAGMKLDRALSLAQRARLASPKNPAVLDTIGVVHLRRREYSQAVEALRDAAALAALPPYVQQPDLAGEIRRHLTEACLRAGLPASETTSAGPRHRDTR